MHSAENPNIGREASIRFWLSRTAKPSRAARGDGGRRRVHVENIPPGVPRRPERAGWR